MKEQAIAITKEELSVWIFKKIHPYLNGKILNIGSDFMIPVCVQNGISVESILENPHASYDAILNLDIYEWKGTPQIYSDYHSQLLQGGHFIFISPVKLAIYKWIYKSFNYWHKSNKLSVQQFLGDHYKIVKMRYFNLIGSSNQTATSRDARYNTYISSFLISDINDIDHDNLFMVAVVQKSLLKKKFKI